MNENKSPQNTTEIIVYIAVALFFFGGFFYALGAGHAKPEHAVYFLFGIGLCALLIFLVKRWG